MNVHHAEKLEVLSLYWHFVDARVGVVFHRGLRVGTMKLEIRERAEMAHDQ
jgi:hypothetical protein